MKQDIHPKYTKDATVKCVCGNSWKTGSTLSEIDTSICAQCHPFYTGKEKILDTQGRVEKFQKRREKSVAKKSDISAKKKK